MGSKQTVMVCDDEADLLRLFSTALKKRYNVITVTSGKTCIEKYMEQMVRGKKVDILLIDYKLGDEKGDEVACKIRDLDGTKTILISAYEIDKERIEELKENKCIVELINKPVTIKILIERIDALLD